MEKSSRLPGFYDLSVAERADTVAQWAELTVEETAILQEGLSSAQANQMIENVVGTQALPLGIAANFLINGRDYLIPMAIEEPSVVAGASFAARLVRQRGGFRTSSTEPLMIAQMQVVDVADPWAARFDLLAAKQRLLDLADETDPLIVSLGGGARDLEVRVIPESPVGPMLVAHLIYDCRDAMGANTLNTAAEALAPLVEELTGGRVVLRILSNLADRRLARAKCVLPAEILAFDEYPGSLVVERIIEAYALAAVDPYRAATHNKGIMNGIDAVVIATGNDWRAVEAGAHSYAARSGRYTSLTTWGEDGDGNLVGTLELPLAVGIVGGATRVHPTAKVALKILGVETARELAEVIAAVGLAQNLAALRALATEGIQRGHMELHARQVAIASGATGEMVEKVARQLVAERRIRLDRAQEILGQQIDE
ncbi:MAG: hydroxymethylglutaryl-CoA reductase, degradative [Anaerolineales bacterium]|nr:MAG: hydroxymethylglutaryl-CoA reductase, degradative [Anaerolineales bacterium]